MAWNKNVNTNAPSKSFIANLLKAGVAISGCAILFACGDDVTNENITQIVQENVVVVADVSKLPDCTSENEGQQALVKGEPSPRICVDGKWFATFSDYTDKLDDFKCSAEKLKDGSGLKILCNGDSIGVVLNGYNGSNGVNGAQGIQGEKGDKGDTGAQGIQGEKGDKGDTGAQGIQGEKGDKGDTGAQGIQGEKGDKGDTGAQGIQGEKGDKGDTGAQGIQGEKGDKGDTGEGCSVEQNGVLITITCGNQNAVVNIIGVCSGSNENVVKEYENAYYVCHSNMWVDASVLEYDTYGKICFENGAIVGGVVDTINKYVCDADTFRVADEKEVALSKGCVSYTENDVVRKQISDEQDSVYVCKNGVWSGSLGKHVVYGTLLDKRDQKTYKTVVIGEQIWMAENLNYADSISYPGMQKRNWCYYNNCEKYGRHYNWAAAIDSAGTFSTNGNYSGYERLYALTYPVRGICPEGWHLPDSTEWKTLYSAMGFSPYAMQAVGYEKWPDALDTYGFSALPASVRDNSTGFDYYFRDMAIFWSSTQKDFYSAYVLYLDKNSANAAGIGDKRNGYSVRCLKNSL